MMNNTFYRIIIPMVVVTLSALTTPAAAKQSFEGLGDLPGGVFSSNQPSVNADGTVAVGWSRSGSGIEAFRWTSAGGMLGLGDLTGGSFTSFARAVSADGSIVVGTGNSTSGQEGFRWATPGPILGLGSLGGPFDNRAWDVSADGLTIVGWSVSALGREAFLWTPIGMFALGDLPGGIFFSEALAVSPDGLIIVGRSVGAGPGAEAYSWTSGGGMVGLGVIPGGTNSQANALNTDGTVILGQGTSAAAGNSNEAFRWTSAGGMVGIGDLPGGTYFSKALAVSADGSVVVGSGTVNTAHAFIWDPTNAMRNLQDVLVNDHGLGTDLTGWSLWEATGISDDGLTIVGYGTNPSGFTEAWIATLPPELSPGDIDGDGVVNIIDLRAMLVAWGLNPGHAADINGDDIVNVIDLLAQLANWG